MADVSVRVAWADDASAIARVQLPVWGERFGELVPPEFLPDAERDLEAAAAAWHASLTRPPDARHRVLVALERNTVTGFVLTGPSPDPDSDPIAVAEVSELTVAGDKRGQGHGSRLMQAAADTMISDRFTSATLWVNTTDDAMLAFARSSGWAPDTSTRELEIPGASTALKQVRLHTALA